MRLWRSLICLVFYLRFCSSVNLDIFKWPTLVSHPKLKGAAAGATGALEELARLKAKAFRKIGQGIEELKSKVDDFTENLFSFNSDGDDEGYQVNEPSHYGQTSSQNNGYFNVVHRPETSYGAPDPPQKEYGVPKAPESGYGAPAQKTQSGYGQSQEPRNHPGSSQSSYSSLDSPVLSVGAQSRSRHLSKSASSDEKEVNAPLAAAMTMGSILGKTLSRDSRKVNDQWVGLFANQTNLISSLASSNKVGEFASSSKFSKSLLSSVSVRGENSDKPITIHTQLQVPTNEHQVQIIEAKDIRSSSNVVKRDSNNQAEDIFGKSVALSNVTLGNLERAEVALTSAEIKLLASGVPNEMMFGKLLEVLRLTVFMKLIKRANLDAMLTTHGGFTIFAPSDSAFALLPRSVFAQLENDTEKLREVILFHVVSSRILLADIRNEMILATASPKGRKIRMNIYNFGSDLQPVVTANGARLRVPDMIASNVIVHVIDKVLYPMVDSSILEHLQSCDTFNGAHVAIASSGMTSVLNQQGPFTFFVPTTDAFSLIDNETVTNFLSNLTSLQKRLSSIGYNARILKTDIVAKNGVIHVIDKVLQPDIERPLCTHL